MKLFLTIAFTLLFTDLLSNTIYVGKDRPISSIKQAIQLAGNGDTILVGPGVYKEGAILLTKSVSLIGINDPIVHGENKHETLLISGNNILIRGIHFHYAGYSALNDFAAIKLVDCNRIRLEKNGILDAYFAIHVSNSSYVSITGNTIHGSPRSEQLTGNGIHLWKSNNATVANNRIKGHRDGIYFEFVTASVIRDNVSENNIRYGLHFMFSNDDTYLRNTFRNNGAGVAVMYSKKVRMEKNHFEKNWGPASYGILLKDISDSHIQQNTFFRNTIGIHLEGTSRMNIEKNVFKENGWAIKVQASCENNAFIQNNFQGNSFDVGTNGSISLNNFQNNYWDKYEGYDLNKDGIGDIPYHPVSMYSMIVEQQPNTLMLYRSFAVQLLDKAEKAIPSLTPENLIDDKPMMKALKL